MSNILLINDISALGNCSLQVNLPVFAHLQHNCMPLVTSVFSCNTAFCNYTSIANDKFGQFAKDVTDNADIDCVYVGFCNDCATLLSVTQLATQFASQSKTVFVDPVMADGGKLYDCFDNGYVSQMQRLCAVAHCITPNLTEACLLAEVDYDQLIAHQNQPAFLGYCGKVFANFLSKVGCKSAVITGVPCGQLVGNVVIESDGLHFVTNARKEGNYYGTGDLFSSVALGKMLNGATLLQATQVASNFVCKALGVTQRDGKYGTDFFRVLQLL